MAADVQMTSEEFGRSDDDIDRNCADLLDELGLMTDAQSFEVTPLKGGVSSEVARVEVGERAYCLKFALAKLKVKEDWYAPVDRNRTEYTWLKIASEILSDNAVATYGRSDRLNGFAMKFISGPGNYLWKDRLLEGRIDRSEARAVGRNIGLVHSASAKPGFDRSGLENGKDFFSLRIEPYLLFSARSHPRHAETLERIARRLGSEGSILIHGDASPKNIIFRPTGPVILDAECATMGDASFDPAFCMNHLILKAIHMPGVAEAMLAGAKELWSAYAAEIDWDAPGDIEARTAELLPALMLARIDGKSPVEYLSEEDRELTRKLSLSLLDDSDASIDGLLAKIGEKLKVRDK